MTRELHDLLHAQAAAQRFAPVDLEQTIRAGRQRLRRRRAARGLGGVAAVAVAVVSAVAIGSSGGPGSQEY